MNRREKINKELSENENKFFLNQTISRNIG